MRAFIFSVLCLTFVLVSAPVFSEYKIILKNGREFIVDDYKEIDGRIKFLKMGGEIEIDKDNIEDIIKTKTKTKEYTPDAEKQEEAITEKPMADEKEKISPERSAAAVERLREIAKRKDELKAVADKINEEKRRVEEKLGKKGRFISIREERELKQRTSELEDKISKFNEELSKIDTEEAALLKEAGGQQK